MVIFSFMFASHRGHDLEPGGTSARYGYRWFPLWSVRRAAAASIVPAAGGVAGEGSVCQPTQESTRYPKSSHYAPGNGVDNLTCRAPVDCGYFSLAQHSDLILLRSRHGLSFGFGWLVGHSLCVAGCGNTRRSR